MPMLSDGILNIWKLVCQKTVPIVVNPPVVMDLKKPPKSLRDRSNKKPGGQQGHAGRSLQQVASPDLIITQSPSSCLGCGACLDSIIGSCMKRRQVFDILQPKTEVTEYQVEEKKCPGCGDFNRASFPGNVRGPVQYGESVQAFPINILSR